MIKIKVTNANIVDSVLFEMKKLNFNILCMNFNDNITLSFTHNTIVNYNNIILILYFNDANPFDVQ